MSTNPTTHVFKIKYLLFIFEARQHYNCYCLWDEIAKWHKYLYIFDKILIFIIVYLLHFEKLYYY